MKKMIGRTRFFDQLCARICHANFLAFCRGGSPAEFPIDHSSIDSECKTV